MSLQTTHPHDRPHPAVTGERSGVWRGLEEYGSWVFSLGTHIVLLFLLSLFVFSLNTARPKLEIVSVFQTLEETPIREVVTEEDTWNTDSDVPVLATTATAVIESATRQVNDMPQSPSEFGMPELPTETVALVPDMEKVDLDEFVSGIQGEVVTTDGDIGSVDRITTEILAALKEHKVLVVWLLDASESLRTRREQVIGRFDRVYQELGELADREPDALLSSVVAFGQKATLMTKTPTSDPETLRKAVRSIPADDTGIENVFSAVHTAAMEYRVQARKGYHVMLVVLTDESGNDLEAVDKAVKVVVEHKMPVYVLGPLAPFSRREVNIRWVDQETSEVFHLPVERGPATAMPEYPVSLFTFLADRPRTPVLSSGFGPFGLAKLTHESGGICFVYNDGVITGPSFDPIVLSDYTPEYVSQTEYRRLVEKHPLRKAVLTCTTALLEADFPQPQTEFAAGGIQFAIRGAFRNIEASYDAMGQVSDALVAARKHYSKEPSNRWRAHFDLLLGQVLVRRLQIESSVPLLNAMYEKPKTCSDVACNAFALSGAEGSSLLDIPEDGGQAGADKDDDDQPEKMSETELARMHLQRVVRDHAGTPWAVMAQVELESALVVQWKETFVEPPEGQPLPWDKSPGEWKMLSEEDRKKLEEARKKFERFRRFREEEKKKKEELARKAEAKGPGGKREPPKL